MNRVQSVDVGRVGVGGRLHVVVLLEPQLNFCHIREANLVTRRKIRSSELTPSGPRTSFDASLAKSAATADRSASIPSSVSSRIGHVSTFEMGFKIVALFQFFISIVK